MIKFVPKMSFVLLSKVEPGSVVRWDGKYGFCSVHERDSNKRPTIFYYDPEKSIFEQVTGEREVIDFGRDLIVQQDLGYFETARGAADVKNHLLIHNGLPKIAARYESLLWLVDLNSGTHAEFEDPFFSARFAKWTLSVGQNSSDAVTLLEVKPNPAWTFAALSK